MCFSAPASFIASGGLTVLGGASLMTAKKKNKILAAIPLLFAVQQAFEGIQWLYLNMGSTSLLAGYGFLFFAFIVWPIFAPTSIFILDKKRRRILGCFIFLGTAVAVYFIFVLLTQSLAIDELRRCVSYTFNIPFGNFAGVVYLLAIFGPLLVSSHRIFIWFGVVTVILAIISWLFFSFAFISVWCFFAAIISSMFFVYIRSKQSTLM